MWLHLAEMQIPMAQSEEGQTSFSQMVQGRV